MQHYFNNQALNMLLLTREVIKNDQSYCYAINAILNSTPCLDDMSKTELAAFDKELAQIIKNKGY